MIPVLRAIPIVLIPVLLSSSAVQPARTTTEFARRVAALSERGGYFDTDNLVSNESSYLQVIPELKARGLHDGAYIGVGPDQNFTYIAETRPAIAFIIDIRRDNLLLHLLFKGLFERSRTRVDYLAQLFGRPVPRDAGTWAGADLSRLLRYLDQTPAAGADALTTLHQALDDTIRGFGVPLSPADMQTIRRFHQRFIDSGPALRFQSSGRPPQGYYPSYRELLEDTDSSGRHANFLAAEDAFQFVKGLEAKDDLIPVVGDLGGPSALAAIGALLAARHQRVTTFYTSNVEFYLFREGTFGRFAANLERLPYGQDSVIIRSIFGRYVRTERPSDDSASQLQRLKDVLTGWQAGRIASYGDLIAPRGR